MTTKKRRKNRSENPNSRKVTLLNGQAMQYVHSPLFEQSSSELSLLLDTGRQYLENPPSPEHQPSPSSDPVSQAIDRTPRLCPEIERALFCLYNYLKYEASLAESNAAQNQILSEARRVQDLITRANLRLLPYVAKKCLRPHHPMSSRELVRESTLPLVRAVEGFDLSLGWRFGTYAFPVIHKFMLEILHPRHRTRNEPWENFLLSVSKEETSPPLEQRELTAQIMQSLSPQDAEILERRFGFAPYHRHSLKELGLILGITAERSRQRINQILRKAKRTQMSTSDKPTTI